MRAKLVKESINEGVFNDKIKGVFRKMFPDPKRALDRMRSIFGDDVIRLASTDKKAAVQEIMNVLKSDYSDKFENPPVTEGIFSKKVVDVCTSIVKVILGLGAGAVILASTVAFLFSGVLAMFSAFTQFRIADQAYKMGDMTQQHHIYYGVALLFWVLIVGLTVTIAGANAKASEI